MVHREHHVMTISVSDKIESLDDIKKRKSTNVPEKTIGGLSQWFPLAFLLMVAYARSSLIRLSSFILRQSRHLGTKNNPYSVA